MTAGNFTEDLILSQLMFYALVMQRDLYFSDNDLSMRRMGGFLVIFGFISAFIGIFAFAFDCNLPRPGNPATSQHSTKNKYQIVYSRFLFHFSV